MTENKPQTAHSVYRTKPQYISHVVRQYCTRLLQHLSLRTQDDQVLEVLRTNEFPKENLERQGHTSHVRRVVRHASELRLLDFGQQVALVDLDVERAFSDGLRTALQIRIYVPSQYMCIQYWSDVRVRNYGFEEWCRVLKS